MKIQKTFLILLILGPINILSKSYKGTMSIHDSFFKLDSTLAYQGPYFNPTCPGYINTINDRNWDDYDWTIMLYVKINLCDDAISRLDEHKRRNYDQSNVWSCSLCCCCKNYVIEYLPLELFKNGELSFKTDIKITIITTFLDSWELTLDKSFSKLAGLHKQFHNGSSCAIQ